MAIVVNRSSCEVVWSAHTPIYDLAEWLINPDLSPVEGVPRRYWQTVGDAVQPMSQAERDAVDAAIAQAAVDADRQAAKESHEGRMLKAFAIVVLNEINSLRANLALPLRTLDQLKTAIETRIDSL